MKSQTEVEDLESAIASREEVSASKFVVWHRSDKIHLVGARAKREMDVKQTEIVVRLLEVQQHTAGLDLQFAATGAGITLRRVAGLGPTYPGP